MIDLYDIREKLFDIITDNASNNQTLIASLKALLKDDNDEDDDNTITLSIRKAVDNIAIKWENSKLHIPCMTHVIQLVVKAFVTDIQSKTQNDEIVQTASTASEMSELKTLSISFYKIINKISLFIISYFFFIKNELTIIF